MAVTQITTVLRPRVITGGPERVLERDPKGTLWLKLAPTGAPIQFWYSKDQGNRWSYSGAASDFPSRLSAFFPEAWHIDGDGFAHVISRKDATTLRYGRGTPNAGGTAWTWQLLDFAPSNQALVLQSSLDIVAFRRGTGWSVFLLAGTTAASGNTLRLTRVDVSSSGGLSVGTTVTVATSTVLTSYPYGCLDFQHTGDGKNPTATPHLYVVTSVNTPDTTAFRSDPLRLTRFLYEAGAWTAGAPVTLDAAVDTTSRTMRCAYDGARVVTAYGTRDRAVGTASAAVRLAEWVEATGAVTVRTAPSPAAGYPLGLSMATEPASDDLYVAAYGETNNDPRWVKFTRATATWGAWATVAATNMGGVEGRVALARYVSSSSVDFVFEALSAAPHSIYYSRLATLNAAPAPPRLLSPSPSAVGDLGTNGVTCAWSFVDPDPGDVQGAWQFRRKVGAGAYSYYNLAADTWGAVAVWNTGPANMVAFGPGAWPNGSTYSWSVNTRDGGGLESGFASDSLVTATAAPVATVTGPLATYYEDSRPVVTWSYTSGSPQRTWQVKVFDLAAYTAVGFDPATSAATWDSAETASAQARSVRVESVLLNGFTYRAYIRVSDANALYSAWSYAEFALLLAPPPAPSLEVLPEHDHNTGLRRARLVLQGGTNLLTASQSYTHTAAAGVDWESDSNADTSGTPWSSAGAVVGNRSLVVKATAAGDIALRTTAGSPPVGVDPPPIPRDFPAVPRGVYTATASFTAATTLRLCRVRLRFYSSADTLLASTAGNSAADATTVPTQVTVTATAPLGTDRVRVVLEVIGAAAGETHYADAISVHPGTATAFQPGGFVRDQVFAVTRYVDGDAPAAVRTATALVPDAYQHAIAYDREMPFGIPVSYTAQAISVLTEQPLASALSAAALVVIDSDVWGLRDPLDPAVEVRALVVDHKTTTKELTSVYRPAGRSLPLVESEGVQGEDGNVRIHVDSLAERHNLRGLLRRPAPMLLQSPSGDRWYVRFLDRGMTHSGGTSQEVDAAYVEVARP